MSEGNIVRGEEKMNKEEEVSRKKRERIMRSIMEREVIRRIIMVLSFD